MIEKSLLYQRILFIAFWIRALFGFVSDELLPFIAGAQSYVFLAFDVTLVALGLATIRKKWDIIILCSFIVISYFTTCIYNNLSLGFYLNGLRDFITFLFLFPIFSYFFDEPERKRRFVEDFDKTLLLFLIIQFPCLVFQFLKYGANDHGGGSLGNWNSGVISTLIYLISFYLIQKKIDLRNYMSSLWKNKLYIILLLPSFLNETKISFIYFVLYFALLIPIDKKMFFRVMTGIPVLFLLIWIGATAYITSTGGSMGDVFSLDYYMEGYLLSEDNDSENYAKWLVDEDNGDVEDIPRFTKILLLDQVNNEHPGHIMTGFGVGQFKGGTIVDNSSFFKEYEWLLIGSIPYIFHLIIQMGIIGIIWIISFWVIKLGLPRIGYKRNFNLQVYIILIIVMLFFYNDTFRNPFMCLVIIYLIENSFLPQKEEEEELDKTKSKIIIES